MTDTRLRILEREAISSFDARIRLLVERMRAELPSVFACTKCKDGFIERKAWDPEWSHIGCRMPCPKCNGTGYQPYRRSVELMAYCKDEAAREAIGFCCDFHLGNTHPTAVRTYTGVYNSMCQSQAHPRTDPTLWFIKGLERWNTMTLMRAGITAAWLAVHKWEEGKEFTGPSHPMLAIMAVEKWIKCPCEKHQKVCGNLYYTVDDDSFTYWLLRAASGHEWKGAIHRCVIAAELCVKKSMREPICAALIEWCK